MLVGGGVGLTLDLTSNFAGCLLLYTSDHRSHPPFYPSAIYLTGAYFQPLFPISTAILFTPLLISFLGAIEGPYKPVIPRFATWFWYSKEK